MCRIQLTAVLFALAGMAAAQQPSPVLDESLVASQMALASTGGAWAIAVNERHLSRGEATTASVATVALAVTLERVLRPKMGKRTKVAVIGLNAVASVLLGRSIAINLAAAHRSEGLGGTP